MSTETAASSASTKRARADQEVPPEVEARAAVALLDAHHAVVAGKEQHQAFRLLRRRVERQQHRFVDARAHRDVNDLLVRRARRAERQPDAEQPGENGI